MTALLFLCLETSAMAAEGEPLLSYDDLMGLQDSYGQFLERLADLLVQRDLLSQDERQAWIALEQGDFLGNGGYGSIMTNFYPGVLEYAQEEEQLIDLHAIITSGVMNLLTMRRYSPDDSSLSGLILTPGMQDDNGSPIEASFAVSASDGVFYKWDAMTAAYTAVGTSTRTEGETILWSCAVPAEGAQNPTIQIDCLTLEEEEPLGEAVLELEIDAGGYVIRDGALRAQE